MKHEVIVEIEDEDFHKYGLDGCREIIRCKDCKWYGRADKSRFYRGMDCLNKRIATIDPDMDYCSKAERRTDGQT